MAQLEEWFHAEFRQSQNSVTELPHAREFLEFCRAQKIPHVSVEHRPRRPFQGPMPRNGFDAFIDKPYTDVWDKRKKIHEILAENDLQPDETLFIGDMEHDIATAKHGGVHSCAVLTGYNTLEQLRAAEPDLIVEHLANCAACWRITTFSSRRRRSSRAETPMPLATVGALIFNHQRRSADDPHA